MMKMDKSNEPIYTQGRMDEPKVPAKEIGREFVRHYYTMLSEKPHEAGRFYSHESYFIHNDEQEVRGTERIQKAIENLNFQDCKARIYSVTGTNTVNNGLVLQVCGELALKSQPKRRFCQTFVLYPQSPKKFYVHDDVFQWLDKAFGESTPQPAIRDESEVTFSADQLLNGHKPTNLNESVTIDGPTETVNSITEIPPEIPQPQDEFKAPVSPGITEETPKIEELNATKESEIVVSDDKKPKTWATMVSASGKTTTPLPQSVPIQATRTVQTVRPTPTKPSQDIRHEDRAAPMQFSNREHDRIQARENGGNRGGPPQRSELTLFVSNIPRHDPHPRFDVLESELRAAFEAIGKVQDVSIPKSVKEEGTKAIYVFVDMETKEDVNKVFEKCRKDEHNRTYLEISLPVIDFKAEVNISNRRDARPGGARGPGPRERRFEGSPGSGPRRGGGRGGGRNFERRGN